MARVLRLAGVALGGLLYVWFAGVRSLPTVRRRKARMRSARR
ncbi:MAG TPA: hypothetical protein VNH40_04660 [Gaiellaceae bacterium]|nr:hypothetical protein [Gaiellaceae bacterium]